MSSFDCRFDIEDELTFKILNYLEIAASCKVTQIVPTNIRGSLDKSRAFFIRAKDHDMKLELLKVRRRQEIEVNIAAMETREANIVAMETRKEQIEEELKEQIEKKLKLEEQIETDRKEIEQKFKQNEQCIIENEQKMKQIELLVALISVTFLLYIFHFFLFEESEQSTSDAKSEPDQSTGKVLKEESKQTHPCLTKPEPIPEIMSIEVESKSKRGEMRRENATTGCANPDCSKIGNQRYAGCPLSLYCGEVCYEIMCVNP